MCSQKWWVFQEYFSQNSNCSLHGLDGRIVGLADAPAHRHSQGRPVAAALCTTWLYADDGVNLARARARHKGFAAVSE